MQALREENRRLKTPPPQAQQVPDRYEDPEAYGQWRDQQVYQQTLNTKLDLSEDIARTHHGDEAVDKARDWALQRFEASPAYYQEVMGSRNPYAKIVADHQRDELVTQLKPEDFQAFRAWQQAQAAIQPVAAPPAAAPPNRPPAPRSPMSQLAAAGGSKPGQEPVYPGKAFEDVFPK
ncbi:MAG: hypothetical protein EON48_15285 [Acetobacteraceae bacterium]|nr:MAG: hypothetical protein EON48_15285 [Acetobacteraceae bacterium]